MNVESQPVAQAVEARLGERAVRVRVVEAPGADGGMGSVGLASLDLGDALDTVGEAAHAVYERLKDLKPDRASVEFGVSFSAQGGKITALLFDGKAQASLTIRMDWGA